MAKLVFGMNQSLDGYVDHQEFAPSPALFRHWIEHVRDLTGSVYGRRMYEAMRYWDEDRAEWGAEERDFAAVWRSQPKWVVSRSLTAVCPNATLVVDDVEAVIRGLKAKLVGELQVGGPESRLRKFEQVDKWSFCLTTAIIAVNRRDHEQTTAPEPHTGLQGEGGARRRLPRDLSRHAVRRRSGRCQGSSHEPSRQALHRCGCADCAAVSARHRTHLARHRAPRITNPPASSPGASR